MTELTIDPDRFAAISGELADQCAHFGVVGDNGSALAEVARGAGQNQVVFVAGAPLRRGDLVVDMEDLAVLVEKTEDAALRDFSPAGPLPAVGADTPVSLAHSVANRSLDVAGVGHAVSIATGFAMGAAAGAALAPTVEELQRSAIELYRDMIKDPS